MFPCFPERKRFLQLCRTHRIFLFSFDSQAEYDKVSKQLSSLEKSEEDARQILKSLEDTTRNSERERLKQQAHKVRRHFS